MLKGTIQHLTIELQAVPNVVGVKVNETPEGVVVDLKTTLPNPGSVFLRDIYKLVNVNVPPGINVVINVKRTLLAMALGPVYKLFRR